MFVNFILHLALLPVVSMKDECTLHELQNCLESLRSVAQGRDLVLAATNQELQVVCKTLKESVWCVDNHMKHCFTSTQRKVFNHVVQGARKFLLELCVPGPIQETYLKHASCYKNVSLSENKCAPKYRHLIQLSEKMEDKINVDDGLRESCCAFNELVQCKYMHVRRDCGQESANFLQQHLDRITNSLIHEHCAHYMYAINSCTSSAASKNLSLFTNIIIGLVLTDLILMKCFSEK
ncbi:uncharacterized protein NPIL_346431 [Nephila pilipes]|uniref:Venom protein n=1 Tax=Nephila pilipes TaxID=299642 RepID=A0A8X6MZI5_NEPPI|nr:uncharacterized protein NPIL_346431 [Nephila pilipes]